MTLAPEQPPAAPTNAPARAASPKLTDTLKHGLNSPICLTWELTYGCNLACVHCLSSSGRRDPRELTTQECFDLIDEFQRMQIFYVNIGGGEPTIRHDFWDIVEYAVEHQVGVKFSTNGFQITPERAAWIAGNDYIDVQISLDGATAEVNDAVRGAGTYDAAIRALENLREAGMVGAKLSVVCTRHNIEQLDEFLAIARRYDAQLRLTRLRPSGRGADVWHELHPLPEQQITLFHWLHEHGEEVLTGDSFFHLSAMGEALPGMNLCGAGRIVCLVDPVGEVYACPFAIHENFAAGSIRVGGFAKVWRESNLFAQLRDGGDPKACTGCSSYDSCQGGCMAAKFFTGLSFDDPDPECVHGHGEAALARVAEAGGARPLPSEDHSHAGTVRHAPTGFALAADAARGTVSGTRKTMLPLRVVGEAARPSARPCQESPLA